MKNNRGLWMGLLLFCPAAAAQAVDIGVSAADCRKLAGADYVAGVSATGAAVVPADIDGGYGVAAPVLDDVTLPVTIFLEKDIDFLNSAITMGTIPVVKIDVKDGVVYFNGKPVDETTAVSVSKACRNRGF